MTEDSDKRSAHPFEGEFESWADATHHLLRTLNTGEIYRGQRRRSWACDSALERATRGRSIDADRAEAWGLGLFRAYGWRYLSNPPSRHDLLSWLVLAQHYGMPTRLVDWTRTPMTACYFAYRDLDPSEGEDAALWVFDAVSCRKALGSRKEQRASAAARCSLEADSLDEIDPDQQEQWEESPISAITASDDTENDLLRDALNHKVRIPVCVIPPRLDSRMPLNELS